MPTDNIDGGRTYLIKMHSVDCWGRRLAEKLWWILAAAVFIAGDVHPHVTTRTEALRSRRKSQ